MFSSKTASTYAILFLILSACSVDFASRTKPPALATDKTPSTIGKTLIPVLFASGKMQRTLFSCDGGRSWVGDQSADDTARCFQNGLNCDHNPLTDTGLAISDDGYVVLGLGHGFGGDIVRSADGVEWDKVASNFQMSGLLFSSGKFFAGRVPLLVSSDSGLSWSSLPRPANQNLAYQRTIQVLDGTVKRLLILGDYAGGSGGRFSDDEGASWNLMNLNGCVYGPVTALPSGIALMKGGDGSLCRSVDRAETWNSIAPILGTLTIVDGRFVFLNNSTAKVSDDGLTWQSVPATNARAQRIAYNPVTKTYAGVQQSWGSWYESQKFLFSEDGFNWTQLTDDKGKGGHPIDNLMTGYIHSSTLCPGE